MIFLSCAIAIAIDLRFDVAAIRVTKIHGLCAIFASSSRFMRLYQAAFDIWLDSPLFASLSVHGLHFTVYAASNQSLTAAFSVFSCPHFPRFRSVESPQTLVFLG